MNISLILGQLSSFFDLVAQTLYWSLIGAWKKRSFSFKELVKQMNLAGVNSCPIVFLIALFFGLTLAMLTAYQLKKIGSELLIGALVGVSFTRELGPLLTALVVAGRVGAAFTAELGTMKVSEEIDALETIGINPVRFLIVPRFLALLIMLPCLTLFSDVIGILGGYVIGKNSLGIGSGFYFKRTLEALVLKDIYTGLIKSFSFGAIISLIGCYQGFMVRGGAEGVGKATTNSVVVSMILIIVVDCIWNSIFYFL